MNVLESIAALESLGETVSLDRVLDDDDGDGPTLGDVVAGDDGGAARGIYRGALLARVVAVLPSLEPRERAILALRFGIGGTWRQEDVAAAFKMSRANASYVERQAIDALRAVLA